MSRLIGKVLLLLMMAISSWLLPRPTWSSENVGQEHLAYLELSRIREQSKPGVTYQDYKDALVRGREFVSLLPDDSSTTVGLLKKAMSYYEQTLVVWTFQADSEFPVDSLRTDEPNGAAILKMCPDISRFHHKQRDQVYVKDAVECIWHKAADQLDEVPSKIR